MTTFEWVYFVLGPLAFITAGGVAYGIHLYSVRKWRRVREVPLLDWAKHHPAE